MSRHIYSPPYLYIRFITLMYIIYISFHYIPKYSFGIFITLIIIYNIYKL